MQNAPLLRFGQGVLTRWGGGIRRGQQGHAEIGLEPFWGFTARLPPFIGSCPLWATVGGPQMVRQPTQLGSAAWATDSFSLLPTLVGFPSGIF